MCDAKQVALGVCVVALIVLLALAYKHGWLTHTAEMFIPSQWGLLLSTVGPQVALTMMGVSYLEDPTFSISYADTLRSARNAGVPEANIRQAQLLIQQFPGYFIILPPPPRRWTAGQQWPFTKGSTQQQATQAAWRAANGF